VDISEDDAEVVTLDGMGSDGDWSMNNIAFSSTRKGSMGGRTHQI